MSGVLNMTIGEENGQPTVVVAIGGTYEPGDVMEQLSAAILDAMNQTVERLESNGVSVQFIVLKESPVKLTEPSKKRGRKPKSVDKLA